MSRALAAAAAFLVAPESRLDAAQAALNAAHGQGAEEMALRRAVLDLINAQVRLRQAIRACDRADGRGADPGPDHHPWQDRKDIVG